MAFGRTIRQAFSLGAVMVAAVLAATFASRADPVHAGIAVDLSGGYARLVLTSNDEVDASTQLAGRVLIIKFSEPVVAAVEQLAAQAPAYIAAARLDPDGRAIRLALAQPVKVNSIAAAEKFFVDLLPEKWSGSPPGLPPDVIEELARRAREAERRERLEHQAVQQKKPPPIRVHVASQPTFTRYVFDLPAQVDVAADRARDRLTLNFSAPLTFDLADAVAALPPAVAAINDETEQDTSIVRFSFLAKVDARTFRDGNSYVVDLVGADKKPPEPREQKEGAAKAAPTVAENAPPDKESVEAAAVRAVEAAAAAMIGKPNAGASPSAAPSSSSANAAVAAQAAPTETPKAEVPAPAQAAAAPAAPVAKPETAPKPQTAPPQASADAAAQPKASSAPAAEPVRAAAPSAPPAADHAAAETVAPATAAPAMASAASPAAASPAVAAASPSAAAAAVAERPAAERGIGNRAAASPSGDKPDKVAAELSRQGNNLKLTFPFMTRTALAVFPRADTLWLVFDSQETIDLAALDGEPSRTIRGAEFIRSGETGIVRIRLDHPHLSSVVADGPSWTVTVGETVTEPTRALDIARNMIGHNRASVAVAFAEPHRLHRLRDPEVGDDLLVVTGFAPARGFIGEQDFIEFHALASTQGVAIEPIADDVTVELAPDKVVVGRPGGLTLSSSLQSVLRGSALRSVMFDSQLWGLDREATFNDRQAQLVDAAASAPVGKRLQSRLDLARFYIAREMYPEAKGVLDTALADDRIAAQDVSAIVLRAIVEVMINRPEAALKDLATPTVGDQHDAPLWRALAYARQGKWAMARDNFKAVEASIATLPVELQRVALKDEMRAAIEVGDFAGAADQLNDIETIGLPRELQPPISVLIGRLSEGLGRNEDALAAYRTAADSWDRPAAAQGRLREVALRYKLGEIKRDEVLTELETLTTVWRGDETEIEALQMLARLYTDEGRFRDSFYVMRTAIAARPNSDMTRRIQDEAAATFDSLFLAGRGDGLSAVDALALFYDFRELTPIGRRGDEMIRRLADRLVAVDLLDQAAELLQYQVDQRLQGAARSQVATRLAVVYLMNRKPDRALATLRASRTADVAKELRNQRLLLEARAFSDLGRHDLALEVVAHLDGREVIRLRSDILWAARRWAKAAEQIELYYGERWKDWQPLNEVERSDILRGAIGYALGDDSLGLGRFREKYAAKMAQTPDARAFEIVSAPLGTNGAEFRGIARAAASVDTLEGFLRDMQARYPDAAATSHAVPPAAAPAVPAAGGAPTSSAAPVPPARAAGRSAQR